MKFYTQPTTITILSNAYLTLFTAGFSREMGSPGRLKTFPFGLARGDVDPVTTVVSTERGACLFPYSSSENNTEENSRNKTL